MKLLRERRIWKGLVNLSNEFFEEGYQVEGGLISRYFGPEWFKEQADSKGIALPRGCYGKNGRLEDIMRLIVQGQGTREIVRSMRCTGRTVRKYRDILQKLGVM